jgi:hypothetical protein
MSKKLFFAIVSATACTGVSLNPQGHLKSSSPDASQVPDAHPPPVEVHGVKHAFVTSQTYEGGLLGGLAGADAKCNALASAAGLGGLYAAWLSDSSSAARDRLTHALDGYVLGDGTVVAASWNDLVTQGAARAIDRDETGAAPPAPSTCFIVGGITPVWTGTRFDGTYAGDPTGADANGISCSGWTALEVGGFYGDGLAGNANRGDSHWTDSLCAPACTETAALYCLEQ